MNISYSDGRTEELHNLVNEDILAKLKMAMEDRNFADAFVYREPTSDGLTPTERMEQKKETRKRGVTSNRDRGRR